MNHTPRAILTAAAAAMSLAVPMAASAAVPPPPKPPVAQPSAVDVSQPYVGQSVCELVTRPGVADFAATVSRHYNRTDYHTVRTCLGDTSEHYDGRALDWMLSAYDAEDKPPSFMRVVESGLWGARKRGRAGCQMVVCGWVGGGAAWRCGAGLRGSWGCGGWGLVRGG